MGDRIGWAPQTAVARMVSLAVLAAACAVASAYASANTAARVHGSELLMDSPAAVKKACAAILAGTRRQHARWRVVCPPKIPRVSHPSVIYVGGAASTSNFKPGYGLEGTGSVYPIVNGYGHWTFTSGSPQVLDKALHPTDAIGRPESTVSSAQKMLVAGQTMRLYRVAPDSTEYAGHVVVEWIDRGQEYQVSVHRWKSDRQGVLQAIGMAAAIIVQLQASK